MAVSPAVAQSLYDNGPINGNTDAWTINFGYVVSDDFTMLKGGQVMGFSFGVWEDPGDVMTSIDYKITSLENGGTVYGSGVASGNNLTDQFLATNQYGYDIDLITVSGLNLELNAGTYWLNLQNAVESGGDAVYWDENSGPSSASENEVGTIPSESFTILGSASSTTTSTTTTGTVPEPSSIMLFVSGILSLAGRLRRKLF
jgi:hypothetical protein